jgi:sugar O-acyltransferase (sialic acid O-acetyltransferase NeuD family)
MRLYGVVGAGGFGREVMPLASAMLQKQYPNQDYQLVFVDDNKDLSSLINQRKVMTTEEFLQHNASEKFFNIAIANHQVRKNIANTFIEHAVQPFRINALNAIELDHNEIGEGAIFCSFTTVTSNVKIGRFFHANIYSYVAHDCIIGDYVTFAPNVHCNGGVIIENNVYVGTGVIIREGTSQKPIVIGEGAILGMGAVVTKSVSPYETVVGNPAQRLKRTVAL